MSKSNEESVRAEFPEFVEAVVGLSVDDLKVRLATQATEYEAVSESQADDEALEEARVTAKELGAPYREAKKALRMKNTFLVSLLKEKGAG